LSLSRWLISMPGGWLKQKNIHLAFEVSLVLKAVLAATEILAGIGAYFVRHQLVFKVVERLTREELLEDPRDAIANDLFHWAQHVSGNTRHFVGLYLLSHGVVKLWLVAGLLRAKLSYYPVAIVIFAAFIAYQAYRFSHTHSLWLLLVTAVDVVVVVLTWHEYRYRRSSRAGRTPG
jgi:uncharacterized membrane protein